MLRQETSNHVERANRAARGIENLSGRGWGVHHSHVVRAITVVEEWQRVKQNTPALGSKKRRQLSNDRLRVGAELMAKHDHQIASRIGQYLACGVDVSSLNAGFLCC